MSKIEPLGGLWLLENVPLDKSYNHTYLFNSPAEQLNKLSAYRKGNPQEMTYIRHTRRIRFAGLADNYQGVNYIIFNNGGRDYFAFVNQIEYVNDGVSEVDFTIDIMQTYMFDYDLGECVVEREHTATDNFGEHTLLEDVGIGDVVINNAYHEELRDGNRVGQFIIKSTPKENNTQPAYYAKMVSNNPVPYNVWAIDVNEGDLNLDDSDQNSPIIKALKIINLKQQDSDIIDFVYVPAKLTEPDTTGGQVYSSHTYWVSNFVNDVIFYNKDGSYYTPKNKKMFCSPYTSILISNNTGTQKSYKTEIVCDISQNKIEFRYCCYGIAIPDCELVVYPLHEYTDGGDNNYEGGVSCRCGVRLPWSVDSFNVWWANNSTASIVNGVVNTAQFAGGIALMATGAGAGIGSALALSGASGIAGILGSYSQAKTKPDTMTGSFSGNLLLNSLNRKSFSIFFNAIKGENAKIIDDYFTVYGYKVNTVKVPTLNNRPKCTYVKTVGCIIHPKGNGMNANAEQEISKIFDKGITFWQSNATIGDYTGNEV